ncbi:acyl-CoA synthetase (AMP-forming)/AMP-acid ligase II [Mumia flava]|uniref:Acyl-CoA synthetase (AMP-forming)/AMP-acid ligase II n=1 Tax=Mumia flava TaxID=1348852 RepID=A0A2M9B804_9ACTN|nr:AMP-binding protein [Mumia flava]PJJ54099.1 acyl-CoA synthetase (AMP-forming)/AMP-acid ligase II [Mumia flava]
MVPKEQVAGPATVAELLRERARERPGAIGYTFLTDGETEQESLSYAGVEERAGAIAAALRAAGAEPGSRALLLLVPGLDYLAAFFGCLYAGVVAVPAYPPDPFRLERTLPRLLAVVSDADPVVALTTSDLVGFVDALGEQAPVLRDLAWLAVDTVPQVAGDPVTVDPEATAFLQYTSGSTAAPRGVMVSHANLLHNLGMIREYFGTDPDSRALIWLPPYHDMGLIGGLLQPLYSGCPVTLISPLHFLEQPMRWLRGISRLGATVSGGPNFAYELCARRAGPRDVAELDLSSWQAAFNGAEPIRAATLDRFVDVFGPAGFRPEAFLPCYGLAEATLIVSGSRPGAPAPRVRAETGAQGELVSCGAGAPDQRIAIVDPQTARRCPDSVVGEIWVAGPSVARGYWRRPAETERVFGARIAGEDAPDAPTRYLRTGDLGFLRDGELVVTGRRKDLVIVRGRNHYPHDIELTAEQAHPALRTGCSAAFQVPGVHGDDRLVLVAEVRRSPEPPDGAAVAATVREAVAAAHGIQVHAFVPIAAATIPKTSSGKIQRSLCRARYLAGDLAEVAPRETTAAPSGVAPVGPHEDVEPRLRTLVAELVGGEPDALDPAVPLLAMGLDSLGVVTLQHELQAALGVALPIGEVLAGATLADVVEHVAQAGVQPAPASVVAVPPRDRAGSRERDHTPLPHGAREIWMMQQLEPDSPELVVGTALRLLEPVDVAALRAAVDAVVARHPALRTTYELRGDEPVQVVHPDARVGVGVHDASALDEPAFARRLDADARLPIDLAGSPPLRLDLYRRPDGDVLLVRIHHIATDFWSSTILAREVGAFYSAAVAGRDLVLEPPRATSLDVAAWRRSVLADEQRVRAMGSRLLAQLSGDPDAPWPRLQLPPVVRSGPGGATPFALSADLTRALRARAAAECVTTYVLLLAAFVAALHRTTGQRDLVVGTPVAGRARAEFADVVGCCTSTMLVRSTVADDERFSTLLDRVRVQVVGALEHQDYPTALLRERHGLGGRGHLADVLFTLNQAPPHHDAELSALAQVGAPALRGRLGSLLVEKFPLPVGGGAVPVEVVIAEVSGAAHGLLRYRAGSLDAAGADAMVERYLAVLEQVAADPGVLVADLTAEQPAGR